MHCIYMQAIDLIMTRTSSRICIQETPFPVKQRTDWRHIKIRLVPLMDCDVS